MCLSLWKLTRIKAVKCRKLYSASIGTVVENRCCGHETGNLPWAHCDEYVVDASARLVGALPEEVSIQNGLSVNLHLLFTAFYSPTRDRHKILIESRAFPSDYVSFTFCTSSRITHSVLCNHKIFSTWCLPKQSCMDMTRRKPSSVSSRER